MDSCNTSFDENTIISSARRRISLEKFLEDLKSFEANSDFETLHKYTEELMVNEPKMEFQEPDSGEKLNECMQLMTKYVLHSFSYNTEEQVTLRKLLFLLSVKKLNTLQNENLESNELRLLIINNGCRLVKMCADKEHFTNIDYFICQIKEGLDELESFTKKERIQNKRTVFKRIEISMYNAEIKMKQNKLVEAMEELNRQSNSVMELKLYQEYFVTLSYNISLKCNGGENYDYALTALLLAYDVCKGAAQLSENMKTALRFMVCMCLKHNPNKNWHYGIKALELINEKQTDIFYVMSKLKFAFIAQNQTLVEECLSRAAECKHLKIKEVTQIVSLLQKNDLFMLAAEFVQTIRCNPFSVNDKFLLLILEMEIYISANDRKLFSLLDNAVEILKRSDIDETSILKLFNLLSSYACCKFAEKNFNESLTWYAYCEQICEAGCLNPPLLHYVQTRICLCQIELNDWKSAKESFEKLRNNCDRRDPSYVYLALQIAFLNNDESIAREVLNGYDKNDSKTGDILLSCCQKALSSGKREVLFKILETLLLKQDAPEGTLLAAKLSQCIIGLCADSAGNNEEIIEKALLFMDKALCDIQQNPSHEDSCELSQWFSRAAWNLALTPGIEPKYTFEFFLRCCCFSEALSARHVHRLKNSLMLAAASGLHVVRKMGAKKEKRTDKEAILRKVMTVIEKCKSLETGTNVTLLRLLYLYEFEARCHLDEWDDLVRVKEILRLPFMDIKTLEHIAAVVNRFSPYKYEIIIESLTTAVQKIADGQPEYSCEASKTYHSLVQVLFYVQEYLCQAVEEENFLLCSTIKDLIKNKQLESYPQVEILWLMTKCWNWGIQKLISNDSKKAYNWCTLAIAFMQKLDSLKTLHEAKLKGMYIAYFQDFTDATDNCTNYLDQ